MFGENSNINSNDENKNSFSDFTRNTCTNQNNSGFNFSGIIPIIVIVIIFLLFFCNNKNEC